MTKIRWGVLGVAGIAVKKVIPAMQQAQHAEVTAIASRDPDKARAAAKTLGIPKSYGSYEELLADPKIDAIYNPLPNHLHVPWSIKAAEAGKHVLCEKPIGLNVEDARKLIAARDRTGVKIGEAFMIVTHPQWARVLELARHGIGEPRAVQCAFSYTNTNPANIRNMADIGGGGLMDIGCYGIKASRLIFNAEPVRVIGLLDLDPMFKTDRLTSAMLDFGGGRQAVFTCSTQMVPYQVVQIYGALGRIEMEIPFNAIPNESMWIKVDDGSQLGGASARVETVPPCDQYTLQADEFSLAIQGELRDVPVSLEDAARNMAVIDAIVRSSESGHWETPVEID